MRSSTCPIWLSLFFVCPLAWADDGSGISPQTVQTLQEVDGWPVCNAPIIEVSNDTLTDNSSDGKCTVTTGAGGGSGDITSVGDVTSGAAFDGTQGAILTFYDVSGAGAANQTLSYNDAANDFWLSDDLDIIQLEPHLTLDPTTAGHDSLHIYAFGDEFYFNEMTDGTGASLNILKWNTNDTLTVTPATSFTGAVTLKANSTVGDASAATFVVSSNLSGATDPTLTFGNLLLTASNALTISGTGITGSTALLTVGSSKFVVNNNGASVGDSTPDADFEVIDTFMVSSGAGNGNLFNVDSTGETTVGGDLFITGGDATFESGATDPKFSAESTNGDLLLNNDFGLEDATPHLEFRDTTDNVAYMFHLDSGIAPSSHQFALWRGTDAGNSAFTVSPNTPLLSFDNSNAFYLPQLPSCNTIDTDALGQLSCGTDEGGAGSGDAVTVNTTAIDTTANLKDTATVTWALVDGGAGGPDDAQATAVDVTCTDCLGTTEIADSYVLNTGDTMTGNLTIGNGVSAGTLSLLEGSGGGTNVKAFASPATITADTTCTFEDDANFIPDSCVGNGTDDGGSETNSLEVITTGIASTEIPIGTAADTVVYAALSGEATMTNGGVVTLADTVTVTGWVLGTSSATTFTSPTVNIDLLDGVGAVDMDYGSVDITDHTFITDSTGDAEIVLPLASVSLAETLLTAGRSLTLSTNDVLADAETYTTTKCYRIADPLATDDDKSIFIADGYAATVTRLWCESDGTVNMMLQTDDGSPSDMDTVDLACISTPDTDTSLDGDATLASGDRVDVDIASVSGTPTWVTVCFTATLDD